MSVLYRMVLINQMEKRLASMVVLTPQDELYRSAMINRLAKIVGRESNG